MQSDYGRQEWLKQQENLSEQLRQHPDKQLQQELEAQINRNPRHSPIVSLLTTRQSTKGG